MKRQLDRLKGKRLVTGDPNLMTKDEVCINATPNGVEVKEIGTDGKIKDLAGSGNSGGGGELDINSLTLSDLNKLNTFDIITREYPYFISYDGIRYDIIGQPTRIEQKDGYTFVGINFMAKTLSFSKDRNLPPSNSIGVSKAVMVEEEIDGSFVGMHMCAVMNLSFVLICASDKETLNLLMDNIVQNGI